jgi:hypothetical protein
MTMPLVALLFINIGLIFGLWVFFNTEPILKAQTKLYEQTNWLMVPISMLKEIRNTRIMALILILISVVSAGYLIMESF